MPSTFNTKSKTLIRSDWNKNIIKFVNKELGCKLVYLGLPSPDAEDILEWIEYIDEVVAFQCRDYPNPSNETQSTIEVERLHEKLSELERRREINRYFVYDGYIEEVLLNRRDNAGIDFRLNNSIHLYNLDFCNSITSPIEIIDENGDVKEVYKFDAVKVLLELQKLLNNKPKKFIMFLTIHASYNGKELVNFNGIGDYKFDIKSLKGREKKIRFLRSYVLDTLKTYFQFHDFIPVFLPVISYSGVRDFNLLHFTIIGTSKNEKTGIAPFFQEFDQLIREKFISIKDGKFVPEEVKSMSERDININPVDGFTGSKVFKELWKKEKNEEKHITN